MIFKSIFDGMFIDDKAIKIELIKRPKQKPLHKLKLDGVIYYITDLGDKLVSFVYKSYTKEKVKNEVIASIFDKELCKGKDYMTLDRKYNKELNKWNKEDFIHSQYITSTILDNIYRELNKEEL